MTVAALPSFVRYIGNGATTNFPFSFSIRDASHLKVYVENIATGDETLLASGTYSSVGIPGTGSVTYNPNGVPIPATQALVIRRIVPLTQDMDITSQGGFDPTILEEQLDRIVMMAQQDAAALADLAEEVAVGGLPTSTDVGPKNVLVVGQSNAALQIPGSWVPSVLHNLWSNDMNGLGPETVTGLEHWIAQPATWGNEINFALSEEAANDRKVVNQITVAYGGMPICHGLWGIKGNWSTNTAATDPGAAGIKGNNATLALVTALYINDLDRDAVVRDFDLITLSQPGSYLNQPIRIRNEAGTIMAQYRVTGAPVDNAGWWTIPVAWVGGAGGLTNGLQVRTLVFQTDFRVALEAHVPVALAAIGETVIHELHIRWGESDTPAPTRIVEDLEEFVTWLETHSWFPEGTSIVVHGHAGFLQTADDKFRIGNMYQERFASMDPARRSFRYAAAWPRDPNWDITAAYYHMTFAGAKKQGHMIELGRQGYNGGLRYDTLRDRENGDTGEGGVPFSAGRSYVRIFAGAITDLCANLLNHASNTTAKSAQASTNLSQIFAQAPLAGGVMGLLTSGIASIISGAGTRISFKPGNVEKVYADATGLVVPAGSKITLTDAPGTGTDGVNKTYADGLGIPIGYLDTDGTFAANSDTKVASQKAAKTYMDGRIAAQDAMVHKGVIDCSANPNYPAGDRGWTYRVSVAGKIGGAAGIVVENGDLIICQTDGTASGTQAAVGAQWDVVQTNLDGAVIGPAAATSANLARYSGATGKVIDDSGVAVSIDGTFAANSDAKLPSEKAVKTFAAATYQAITAALTSWVAVVRAAGFDTFVATPSSANFLALLTTKTGTGNAVFGSTPTLVTPLVTTRIEPDVDGTADLGQSTKKWANAWFKLGSVLTFGADTLTHSSGVLTFSGIFLALSNIVGSAFVGSSSPIFGVGYTTGAGGSVAQATSKATGVAMNKMCGQITMNAASLAAGTIVSFTNTAANIAAIDTVVVNHVSGGTLGAYTVNGRCGAGSVSFDIRNNTAGALAEALVLEYAILKAVIT